MYTCGTAINLSILDFKYKQKVVLQGNIVTINLSILDFKCVTVLLCIVVGITINLSKPDFKRNSIRCN